MGEKIGEEKLARICEDDGGRNAIREGEEGIGYPSYQVQDPANRASKSVDNLFRNSLANLYDLEGVG